MNCMDCNTDEDVQTINISQIRHHLCWACWGKRMERFERAHRALAECIGLLNQEQCQ